MRCLIAITVLLLLWPTVKAAAGDDLPQPYATPTVPHSPAGKHVVLSATTPSHKQRGADEVEFPSPNQARREGATEQENGQNAAALTHEPQHVSPLQDPRPLMLQPPTGRSSSGVARPGSESAPRSNLPGPLTSLITIASSLAIVLGLFFTLAWFMRRNMPKASTRLPDEIVQVLGRTNLGRQPVQLVRCGNKLILLATSPSGVTPLTEITDPLEVDRLAGLCQQSQPYSATQAFSQMFQQASQQDTTSETVGRSLGSINELAGSGGLNQWNPQAANHG